MVDLGQHDFMHDGLRKLNLKKIQGEEIIPQELNGNYLLHM